MGRITSLSIFASIFLIGVANAGMSCPLYSDPFRQILNFCPLGDGSFSANYCCLRPSGPACCEAAEFFGVIFGSIFILALSIAACCACCACCPCYSFFHRNASNVAIVQQPTGYSGIPMQQR